MNNFRHPLRRAFGRGVAFSAWLMVGALPALAAQTDISSTPLASSTSAQVKPNIMLLMDTSGSMGWGHMPDEVEDYRAAGDGEYGFTKIGYKSAQCNVLYYNPSQTYALPKKPNGDPFPPPSFTAAPYAGYASYYAAPDAKDLSSVDLSAAYRGYDYKSVRHSSKDPVVDFGDTARPAYYYVYSGHETLNYATSPCNDVDEGVTKPSLSGGGTWTRKLVSAISGPGGTDERTNFAIWYSYYRTRMSMAKSAVSLAFTPLTDSKRVGFITMYPTFDSPTAGKVNPAKYLAIDDFNSTQRGLWFGKLFSQIPGGSSPAREGLARVGRYYANQKDDGINKGMGEVDPVQHSCQQNFTIMTTDGYWNSQEETPGGGPVKIDGTTRVGQQDGTLTDGTGLTPRPIWDGTLGSTSVTENNVNTFNYGACGSFATMSTVQWRQSTTQTVATKTTATRHTEQTWASTEKVSESTAQMTRSTLQHTQSTLQIKQSTSQWSRRTSQLIKTTLQGTGGISQLQIKTDQTNIATSQKKKSTSQLTRRTSQLQQRTLQHNIATSQTEESTLQRLRSTSQLRQSTSRRDQRTLQKNISTSQRTIATVQWRQSTVQAFACDARTEQCTPVPNCTPGGYISCDTIAAGPTLVAACNAADPDAGNGYKTTTCVATTTGPVGTASCTQASASAGNNYITTTCNTVTTGPTPTESCTGSAAASGNSYVATTCNDVTTGPTAVATCNPVAAGPGNSYIAITCTTVATGPTGVQTCTAALADANNGYTKTTCNTATTGPTGVQTCSAVPAGSGNQWLATSCDTATSGPTLKETCNAATAKSGNFWKETTCHPITTGPTPVASCTPVNPTAVNGWKTTTCPDVPTAWAGVASCTPVAASLDNSWTATECRTDESPVVGVQTCSAAGASFGNSWKATICNTVVTGPTPFAVCDAATAGSGNDWTKTTCDETTTGPTPIEPAACAYAAANAGNNYTETSCPVTTIGWVDTGSCNAGPATAGNSWTETNCQTRHIPSGGMETCTPSGPDGNGVGRTCTSVQVGPLPAETCVPANASAGNDWTKTSCTTEATGPTFVASCTPEAKSQANDWTERTCSESAPEGAPVAACTPVPGDAGNNYLSITCETIATPPTGVGSCTPREGDFDNGYTTTVCNDVVTGPVGVASCSEILPGSGNGWKHTSCTPVNTGPTLVAACRSDDSPNAGNGYTTTTCTTAASVPAPVASCAAQAASSENGYVTTICDTQQSPPEAVAACTPVDPTVGNGYMTTVCGSTTTGPLGVAVCDNAEPNSENGYVANTCTRVDTPPTLVATCTDAVASEANQWTTTTCNATRTGPTQTENCLPLAAVPGNNYTTTTCDDALHGKKLQVQTTRTVTTAQYSGTTVIGTPVVTTTAGDLRDVTGACFAPGTEPALPSPNPRSAGTGAGDPVIPSWCMGGWPCTQSAPSNATGSIDSLADVAQYYYVTPLRTGADWPTSGERSVPAVGSGPEDDRATWQHMTTFTIALGYSGLLNYQADYVTASTGDFAGIRNGTGNWPLFPDPNVNYDGNAGGSFELWNDPRSIDDFWHAAVNGRGRYFNASDPTSVVSGLSGALAGIEARVAAAAGAATSTMQPVSGDNFVFYAGYVTSKWTGEVQGSTIDLATGHVNPTVSWSAQTLLDARRSAACDTRNIYLLRPGATNGRVNFSWDTRSCDAAGLPTGAADTGLNAAERAEFGTANVVQLSQHPSMTDGSFGSADQRTPAVGANLVNFLRGQSGLEGFTPNDAFKLYRTRDHVLGDIVNAQPVYVKAPFASYADSGYSSFKSSNANRTPMLYVAANDGMLHAFKTGTDSSDPEGGKEAWAIIPSSVLPKLYLLADNEYRNRHQFSVDGTPTVGDVYDSTAAAWRTILVGGLNLGGKGYYAVDVTDPASPKGLWEFKWSDTCYDGTAATAAADCHLGYSFGRPLISKLDDGRWVVMVTSGYNNVNPTAKAGDGLGYLYVLDATTGQIISKTATSAGDATTPSGLAQINNYVDNGSVDNTTLRVYGGDLLGNVWRFDVNTPPGPGVNLLGTAKDSGDAAQPITTRPELAELGGKPMVFIATGRLLGASDVADTAQQSVYGIVDPLTGGPVYSNLRTALKPLGMTQVGSVPTAYRTVACAGGGADCDSNAGWVVDLPDAGERVNVDMKLVLGTLVIGSNVPQSSACSTGGYSWFNYLDFATGSAVSISPNAQVSEYMTNSLIVGFGVIRLPDGTYKSIIRTSDGSTLYKDPPVAAPPVRGKRISWREIAR